MTPHELLLRQLVRAREDCLERRAAAQFASGSRVRAQASESELADITESIQALCASTGLPLPDGIAPLPAWKATGVEIAQRVLASYLKLLAVRRRVRDAAARAGDLASAMRMELAIREHEDAVRKHCERARLPLPAELSGS